MAQRDETVLAVGVPEAARRLGVSTRTVGTLVARYQLPSRKIGRRRVIPVAALEAFIGYDHTLGRATSLQSVERIKDEE